MCTYNNEYAAVQISMVYQKGTIQLIVHLVYHYSLVVSVVSFIMNISPLGKGSMYSKGLVLSPPTYTSQEI